MKLPDIENARKNIEGVLIHTPVIDLCQTGFESHLPADSRVSMKLELFQKAGSFKARGCYLWMKSLSLPERQAGVVAASGGNHAIAVAWAARAFGVQAKIAVPRKADRIRLDACRQLGAEIIPADDIHEAFDIMHALAKSENRVMIHPFEGIHMSLGAATCGREYYLQRPDLDVVIVPVGGGGLISGMAAAFKLSNPDIEIYGVEPNGADTMFRSFQAGFAQAIANVDSIADSLCSPTALPLSFGLTKKYAKEIAKVSDDALRGAMRLMNTDLKLMPEPACAASLAGMLGPLRARCEGKRVGLIACGSNIGVEKFLSLTE